MSLRNDQSPEIVALDAIAEQHRRGEEVERPSDEDRRVLAATLGAGTPVSVVDLTARTPWFDGLAALYAFNASRWDTPANLVYCIPNQQPPGGWDGTVLYVDFTAPEHDTYSIVVSFGGPNAIAHLRGPWGIVNKLVPMGLGSDVIGATWTGSGQLWFTITFSGQWLGQVSAVQIFKTS